VLSSFQLLQFSSSALAKAVTVEGLWVLNKPKITLVLVRRTMQPPLCLYYSSRMGALFYLHGADLLGQNVRAAPPLWYADLTRYISLSVFYSQRDMLLSQLGTQVGTHLLAVRSILFGRRVSLRPESALQMRRFVSTRCQ
jgi:hypothetical protein